MLFSYDIRIELQIPVIHQGNICVALKLCVLHHMHVSYVYVCYIDTSRIGYPGLQRH